MLVICYLYYCLTVCFLVVISKLQSQVFFRLCRLSYSTQNSYFIVDCKKHYFWPNLGKNSCKRGIKRAQKLEFLSIKVLLKSKFTNCCTKLPLSMQNNIPVITPVVRISWLSFVIYGNFALFYAKLEVS